MPQFKVGDAVRVKAGSPEWDMQGTMAPNPDQFGKRYVISRVGGNCEDGTRWFLFESGVGVGESHLEPWNDAEEWNGTAWVAKKTSEPNPAVVAVRGDTVHTRHNSTDSAVKAAESYAAAFPGTEYVVYQEKASFKVEKPSRVGKRYVLVKPSGFANAWNQRIGDMATLIEDGSRTVLLTCPTWKVGMQLENRNYRIWSEDLAKEFVEIND